MKNSLNAKGLSLVEVMVSLALVIVAVAAMSTASYYINTNLQRVDQKSTTINVVDEIRMAISTRNRCTANLVGTPLSMANRAGSLVQRQRISHFDSSGVAKSDVIIQSQTLDGGLMVNDLRVVPVAQIEANKIVGELVVDLVHTTRKDNTQYARRIPIQTTIKDGLIESCSVSADDDAAQMQARICEITSAGNSIYNPETRVCEPVRGEWFEGTEDEASCPAGWKVPPTADKWNACGANVGSFVDTSAGITRVFRRRGLNSFSAPLFLCELDTPANKCSCDYASDVTFGTKKCKVFCQNWN